MTNQKSGLFFFKICLNNFTKKCSTDSLVTHSISQKVWCAECMRNNKGTNLMHIASCIVKISKQNTKVFKNKGPCYIFYILHSETYMGHMFLTKQRYFNFWVKHKQSKWERLSRYIRMNNIQGTILATVTSCKKLGFPFYQLRAWKLSSHKRRALSSGNINMHFSLNMHFKVMGKNFPPPDLCFCFSL